ncbi:MULTISPECIES: sensor histidine kinase [Methanobacterium]|jgi:PAS domain S-box-containing protein|uniref:PAS domain S-box protein n=1 Tax=Methanobacterium subterraneum TaxID=59277 RepID=A0A7K4DJP0_9EURY|nr:MULTISPECIES: PAS domain S-box protein [Methanobacterium]AUB58993.1 histidine kinase [Methanobacterium sp. MZ-A1]MBW4257697.1 PAS domain S-box protein [Methanobacterium sp. YSL]NMO08683.1 PAS domain S-box protein [Methanobacterium subterraneum]
MSNPIRGEFEPLKPDQVPLEDDKEQHSIYLNRLSHFKIYSRSCALLVIILGIISAMGWFLNIPVLRGEFMGFPGTKFNSTLIFIMAGVCLYLLNRRLTSNLLPVTRILAALVTILGALTLLEYATGVNIGMNQLFSSILPGSAGVLGKSRSLGALNFVLVGIALLMASYKYKPHLMQFLTFIVGFLGLLGLSSYFYGVSSSFLLDLMVQMAFLSSLIHIFLSVGILCLYPDQSYMGRITAQNSGGYMARRLLPAALVAVFILDLLITRGHQLKMYSEHFGNVFGIMVTLAFLTATIIWTANILNGMDRERQKSNLKRLELKEFYENLVEGINEGIWVTDRDDHLYFMNRGMVEIAGGKTRNLEGLNVLDLPDEYVGGLKDYYRKAKETMQPVYYDSLCVSNPEGKRSYQSGWIIPRLNNGHFNGAICTVIDQTERKKAEEALLKSETFYRAIFENTGTATIIVGVDTIISMANKRCEALSGYTVEEIENKLSFMDFVHPEDQQRILEYHKMRRSGDVNIPDEYEFRLLDKDGEERQIMLYASIIPSTTDSVVSLLDITQRKTAENEVKRSLNEKELLLREIHHRVKNNMQIISSLLNLQRSYIHDEEAANILQESQGRVKSMALIHEKLYQTSDLARINVEEYIQSLTMNLFHSYTVNPGIKLSMDVSDLYFNIDTAVPLGLIINELVSNSLKYAFKDRDEGEIRISLLETAEPGKYLLLIRDDGTGFPHELDFAESHSLGLQLVNTLVNQLDGEIEMITNGGTTFNMIIHEQKYKERVKPSSDDN